MENPLSLQNKLINRWNLEAGGILLLNARYGKEWIEERSAVNNLIRPRNVFSYTAGLNDVAIVYGLRQV